jgi:NDP-sugar pyrophosphorylase family protein
MHLVQCGIPVHVLYITGHWLDVDNLRDLTKAQAF